MCNATVDEILEELNKHGGSWSCELKNKVNLGKVHAIYDSSRHPAIGMFYEQLREAHESLVEIVEAILEMNDSKDLSRAYFSTDLLPEEGLDYEYVKEHSCFRLLNRDLNLGFLEECSCIEVADLILVPYLCVSEDDHGVAWVNFTKEMETSTGYGVREHVDEIKANTCRLFPVNMVKLDELCLSMLSLKMQGEIGIYVVSSRQMVDGAATALLSGILDDFGDEVAVLPSSIHELLVDTKGSLEPEILCSMVQQVNTECVAREDFLSDNVYVYKKGEGLRIYE